MITAFLTSVCGSNLSTLHVLTSYLSIFCLKIHLLKWSFYSSTLQTYSQSISGIWTSSQAQTLKQNIYIVLKVFTEWLINSFSKGSVRKGSWSKTKDTKNFFFFFLLCYRNLKQIFGCDCRDQIKSTEYFEGIRYDHTGILYVALSLLLTGK